MVLSMSIEISNTALENKLIPLIITLAGCGWTYHMCKVYFETYVAPALD